MYLESNVIGAPFTLATGEGDNDKKHDVDILEYGTELLFESGVELTAWNAVSLELVEECKT